jgi:hypothetical protein
MTVTQNETRCTESALRVVLSGAAALLLLAPSPLRAGDPAPFHALIDPPLIDDAIVGQEVEIHFTVDSTAMQFNGYEVTIQYDPSILDFEGVEEGDLMTDACSQTFEILSESDSTVSYTHVLLCAGVSADGPGVLSTFQFRALAVGESPIVITSNPNRTFVDAGIWISPSHPTFPRQVSFQHGLVIVVDPTSDVTAPGSTSVGLRLEVSPNPVVDTAELRVVSARTGWLDAEVVDVAGRRIWSQRAWSESNEPVTVEWASPRGNSAGIYFVRARLDEWTVVERIVTLR